MITQEDIDAMEDGMGLVERLRGLEVCYQYAGEAAARIEQLERELADAHSDHAEWMQAICQANKNGQQYEALQAELAAEKALADRLIVAAANALQGYHRYDKGLVEAWDDACAAHRKARGM